MSVWPDGTRPRRAGRPQQVALGADIRGKVRVEVGMPVTAVYGALLTLLVVALGTHVSLGRLGRIDGERLRLRVRVHGNLVESAPLFVVLLAVGEGSGGDPRVLHGLGASFVVARLAHAFGLLRSPGPSAPRFLGISATWTLLCGAAFYALWVAWS